MTLTALLVFDEAHSLEEKEGFVKAIRQMGTSVLEREDVIQHYVNLDYNRVPIYLGSGSLSGLTREVQLKILELTAGQIATAFDSSMGFRHGPKSFVNGSSLAFVFVSNDDYTRQYDIDILNELPATKLHALFLRLEWLQKVTLKVSHSTSIKNIVSFQMLTLHFHAQYLDKRLLYFLLSKLETNQILLHQQVL